MRARTASRSELRESPSRVASSFSLGSLSPGPTCPERIICFIPVMASSVRAKFLLQYDRGVRPDRRQTYTHVAIHQVEVERLASRCEIYPLDRSPIRQDLDAES